MPPKRDAGGSCRTVGDVLAKLDAQVQQLETLLSTGEKKEAFEKCENINQESDQMRDQAATDHTQRKKELAVRKQALARKVATTSNALAELRAVQEEAAHMFAQLRAKMVAAPGGGGGSGEAGPAAKRRKQVAFQPKQPQQLQRGA
ncbi:hypothetical protein COHA_009004 [Chlorella ohadii]|uniref:Uncharacterized protein n=1 Tax=Chlorella ohadii TaxID=2649997 RepID=A0AAD5H137_9CHLO|nr:hypothetical protein COHA_009004 [Chlorella ohadii]